MTVDAKQANINTWLTDNYDVIAGTGWGDLLSVENTSVGAIIVTTDICNNIPITRVNGNTRAAWFVAIKSLQIEYEDDTFRV